MQTDNDSNKNTIPIYTTSMFKKYAHLLASWVVVDAEEDDKLTTEEQNLTREIMLLA